MPEPEPQNTVEKPDWQVLLIGGASGTGKTVLAHQLARRFSVALIQIDDIRLSLQRVTSPAEQPALNFFLGTPNVWEPSWPAKPPADRSPQSHFLTS